MWEASVADINRWIGAANRRDVDEAMALFAEGAYFSPGARFPSPAVGRGAIREMIEPYFRHLEGLLVTPLETFVDRNEAVSLVHIVGQLPAGAHATAGKPNRRVSWKGAFRFVFDEDGKIRTLAVYGAPPTPGWLSAPKGPPT